MIGASHRTRMHAPEQDECIRQTYRGSSWMGRLAGTTRQGVRRLLPFPTRRRLEARRLLRALRRAHGKRHRH